MRIDRIRLKNFCGVAQTEVRFAPSGVTLIHGPNETGKSTLMTGIDVLFDHRDDSRKEEVRRTKPVNRDVGSEVEADVEVGDYRFTYFKRFHKDRETVLTIHAPKAESLSGREAHERVRQILAASVDTALWQALRILQGGSLELPTLHDQRALSEALDRAAGQAKSGEKENALFESAYAEYSQYFTDTGREREVPVGQARKRATEAANEERDLQIALQKLEEDVGHFAALEKSVAALKRGLAGLDAAQAKAQTAWDAVARLAERVERAKSAKQLADQDLQSALSAQQQRTGMIDLVKETSRKVAAAKAQNAKTSAALELATTTLDTARIARDAAIATANQCDSDERLRRADQEFRDEEFELLRMAERLQHVASADKAAAAASAVLSATQITEQLRTRIRNAEVKLKTEQAILNSASPQFTITALESVEVSIAGELRTLGAGQVRTVPVSEPVSAKIGNMVELRVEPGTNAETLSQAVTNAERALAKACAAAGVASPEEAETGWAALLDAQRTVADRDRIAKEHLRDLTREQLGERIRIAKDKVDAYLLRRNPDVPLPATSAECKALLESAAKAASDAKSAQKKAEAVFAEVQEHHAKCREDHARITATLEREQQDHAKAVQGLEGERARRSDEALGQAVAAAETSARVSLKDFAAAEESLKSADPESAQAMFESAALATRKAREQCDKDDRELLVLRTRLDLAGDAGLAEALAEAKRVTFEADDFLARLLRRAGAAQLLYETLRSERETMRQAYVAPLREGIERLGRHVFGPTLRVEVDEKLQVVSRTVDGVTVSVKQLSTGAQEQIGLLVRLAAASMVSGDGGVPLVLDDALGSTDESRLEAMGAVLRVASQDMQTIILTCTPERYVHVAAEVSTAMTR
jgi:hypothetical protein